MVWQPANRWRTHGSIFPAGRASSSARSRTARAPPRRAGARTGRSPPPASVRGSLPPRRTGMEVPATGGAVPVELDTPSRDGELARGGWRQRDIVQGRVLDVQDASAGEAMEVVVGGKGRFVQQASFRSLQAKDLADPLQGLQGGVHGVQGHHGMGLPDHLVDLSRAGMPQLTDRSEDRCPLGGELEPVGPEARRQLPPKGGGRMVRRFPLHIFLTKKLSLIIISPASLVKAPESDPQPIPCDFAWKAGWTPGRARPGYPGGRIREKVWLSEPTVGRARREVDNGGIRDTFHQGVRQRFLSITNQTREPGYEGDLPEARLVSVIQCRHRSRTTRRRCLHGKAVEGQQEL